MSLLALGGIALRGIAGAGVQKLGTRAISGIIGKKGRAAAMPTAPGPAARILAGAGRVAARTIGLAPGVMPRRRRRRGISGAELRGFKKVARLLAEFGMRPRGLAHPMRHHRRGFSPRRFGDGF